MRSTDPIPPDAPRAGVSRRRAIPTRRKLLFLTLILLAALAGLELTARGYWTILGLPFWDCQRQIQHIYYTNIVPFDSFMRPRGSKADTVEVLLLGASTLYPNVGPISTMLLEQLTARLHRHVEVVDLAVPAHTTLDSYYKYRELADKSFDLVLVYHAINELRANNCPPAMFRPDYSNYLWYREINAVERGRERRLLAFPITLRLWLIRLSQRLGLVDLIPEDAPVNPKWADYGGDIKTAKPFRANLERIIRLGRKRGEKVVLMTFASYLAPGYTTEKFEQRRLDYGVHWFPVEVWGKPDNVMKGLQVHNARIRELAEQYKADTLFVDQDGLIPKQGRYFNDICHLTTDGCARFVDNLLPVIEPYLKSLLATREQPGSVSGSVH